jgi:hypothetical protein
MEAPAIKFGQVIVVPAAVLAMVAAVGASTGLAADRAGLVNRLGAGIACPRPPLVVDGIRYQFVESYGGDDNVFRLNRDAKFTHVVDGINVNDYYFETVAFRFSDLERIETHADEVSISCKSDRACIVQTSTRPPEERPPPEVRAARLRVCDPGTAQDLKAVMDALRVD